MIYYKNLYYYKTYVYQLIHKWRKIISKNKLTTDTTISLSDNWMSSDKGWLGVLLPDNNLWG